MSAYHTAYLGSVDLGEADLDLDALARDLRNSDCLADWVHQTAGDVLDQGALTDQDVWAMIVNRVEETIPSPDDVYGDIQNQIQGQIEQTLDNQGPIPDAIELWHDGIKSRVQEEIHETLTVRGLDALDGDTIWDMVGPIVQRHIADAQWATDPQGHIAQELQTIGQAHQQAAAAFGRLVALVVDEWPPIGG